MVFKIKMTAFLNHAEEVGFHWNTLNAAVNFAN